MHQSNRNRTSYHSKQLLQPSMTFLTRSMCNKSKASEALLLDQGFKIEIFDRISDVEESWTIMSEGNDIFFSPDFIKIIENYPASDIVPYYGLVTFDNIPVGIVYFQSKYVTLKENLRQSEHQQRSSFQKITEPIKQAVVGSINFQTIICGNLLLTGRYGFCFKSEISRDQQFYLVIQATERLNQYLSKKGIASGLILIKDFFTEDTPAAGEYHNGFAKFTVQPKMILEMKPEWNTFDDYLEDLKSKYRVRARKAAQKAGDIAKKVFTADDIANHRQTIHALYKNVSDQAGFNAFVLHERYFEQLKEALGDKLKLTTYWRNGKMVAFFTSIKNYDVLDAHFLGYEPDENYECQLYLNMLYDLIREAIDSKASKVDMSRTAIEIKSTVGAVPHDMYLYLRHTNKILNKTVETVLDYIKPQDEYIYRSPFRDEL